MCPVRHVNNLDNLGLWPNLMNLVNALGYRQVLIQCQVRRGHQASGRFLRILEKVCDDLPVIRLHQVKNLFSSAGREISQHIYDIILLHIREHIEKRVIIQSFRKTDPHLIAGLLHQRSSVLIIQKLHDLWNFLVLKCFHDLCEVNGLHIAENLIQLLAVAILYTRLDHFLPVFQLLCIYHLIQ